MQLPLKITYRGLEKSEKIDDLVVEYAGRLEKFCDHINRCDVAIEQPNHAHHKGNQFRVRIDVTVSRGHELVSDEQQKDNGAHDPLNKVIHDAFKKGMEERSYLETIAKIDQEPFYLNTEDYRAFVRRTVPEQKQLMEELGFKPE